MNNLLLPVSTFLPGSPFWVLGALVLLPGSPWAADIIRTDRSCVLGLDPRTREVLWQVDSFIWPAEVRVLSQDRFLVCDFGTARVAEIDRKGRLYWQRAANNAEDARRLTDGRTLIVHNGNSRVGIYGKKGNELLLIQEGLDHPTAAFLSSTTSLVIADAFNRRIVEVSLEGTVLRERKGFKKPSHIEPLDGGNLLVTDLDAHTVTLLDSAWKPVWTRKGFLHPTDAKQLPKGSLLIADSGNHRILEMDPHGKVVREILFDQKPLSVDAVDGSEWVVALAYDPVPSAVTQPVQNRPAETKTGTSETADSSARTLGTALSILFVILLLLITAIAFLQRRKKTRPESVSGTGNALNSLNSWMNSIRLLYVGFFLFLNLVLIGFYLSSEHRTNVRILCRGNEIQVFYRDQELGRIESPDIPEEGGIGLTFWKESENSQACERVVVKELVTGRTLYETDFTSPDALEEWKADRGKWRRDGSRGIINETSTQGHLYLVGKSFRDASVELDLRGAAEFAVWVRYADGGNYVRIFLRPQRHLDSWVEVYRNGRRLSAVSRPLQKIVPDFGDRVRALTRTLLRSYFFGWFLVAAGSVLTVVFLLAVTVLEKNVPHPGFVSGLSGTLTDPRIASRVVAWAVVGAVLGLSIGMFTRSLRVAEEILEKMPHVQDSVSYLFQAKILAQGDLYVESPPVPHRRFFDHEFIVNNGKRFGLQSPGTALLLALGVLVDRYWLVNPLLGGLSVIVIFLCGRSCYGTGLGLLAALLLYASPWVPLMSGTLMAHPGGLFTTLLVLWGLSAGWNGRRWWPYLIAGIGLGFLILLRMGDALAVGVPAVLWSLFHMGAAARRDFRVRKRWQLRRLRSEPGPHGQGPFPKAPKKIPTGWLPRVFLGYSLMAVVCLTAIGFLCYYNRELTGDPFTSTYIAYSPHLRMGFGPDVGVEWGVGHDRNKAVTNLRSNLKEFYRYWFPPPDGEGGGFWVRWVRRFHSSWLFAPVFAVFLTLDRRRENLLMAGIIFGTVVVYYCYFHSGISYGPRFYYGLLGPLTLLTARGCWRCASWVLKVFPTRRSSFGRRFAVGVTTLLFCLPVFLPETIRAGEKLIRSFRGYNGINSRAIRTVKKSGISNAVVIVRSDKSWFPYGNVFWSMSPNLEDPVVFVRDQGLHNVPKPGNTPLDNRLLLDLYPDRDYYRLAGNRLIPYDFGN